jgi:hypothetical protein
LDPFGTWEPEQTWAKMSKKRRRRKNENEVIKRLLKGESQTDIAKQLGMSRNTVHAILDATQTEEAILRSRSRLLSMADLAIDRVERSIKSPKREGLDASLAVLKGVGVLEERTKSKVEVESGFEAMSDEQLRQFISEGTNRTWQRRRRRWGSEA